MRTAVILDSLEEVVLTLTPLGITRSAIVRPNVLADVGGLELYFELFVSDFATRPETERSVVTQCRAGIVVCGLRGEGVERVDAIAQALFDLFAAYDRRGYLGRGVRERIYGSADEKDVRVYVVGVERSNGLVVDGRYKVKLSVLLEIYEEKKE